MTKARICDRCGKAFAKDVGVCWTPADEKADRITPGYASPLHLRRDGDTAIDLCPECAHDFWGFMKKVNGE